MIPKAAILIGAGVALGSCVTSPTPPAQSAAVPAAPAPSPPVPAPAQRPGLSPISRLPTPPGATNVPRPAGTAGNLKVLDWAGFKSAVSYTVDDAQPSLMEHYAELHATGVPMTFFINTTNTWANGFTSTLTQAGRDGHEIANHTAHHCHADLDGTVYTTDNSGQRLPCAGASAGAELDDCTAFIGSPLGVPHVWTAAYPFGDVGFKSAAASRFFLSRGVMRGTVAPNDGTDPFELPMWGPDENDGVEKFDAAIDGARTAGAWVIVLLHSIAPTAHRWYATVDISAITGSVAHAKSRGDVWIDTMMNIGAYWLGQSVFSSAVPVRSQDTKAQTWSWTLPEHFPPGKYLRLIADGGTVSQNGKPVPWDGHGYYEIALDAGTLTLTGP